MRIIKDGVYIIKEYVKDVYRIKKEITDADRKFAKNEGKEDKLLSWDCSDNITIHAANLLGSDEAVEFPKILDKQEELWYLSIPSSLIKKLSNAPFIKELRGLQINDGNLKLKKDVIFDNLLYLNIDGNISVKKENLPKLSSLYCKYKEGVCDFLWQYDIFDHLTLRSVNENIFEKISLIKDLSQLQINKGKLDNIDGISTIKSLYWLSLDNLSHLRNLNELANMDSLEYLSIGYCKNIDDWNFLLNIPKLKHLVMSVTSYDDLPSQEILNLLKEKGVVVPHRN